MGCGPAQSPPRCTKCNSPPIKNTWLPHSKVLFSSITLSLSVTYINISINYSNNKVQLTPILYYETADDEEKKAVHDRSQKLQCGKQLANETSRQPRSYSECRCAM